MAEFRTPGRILYGEGAAELLSRLNGQRMLLVYDSSDAGELAQKLLSPSGISIRPFEAGADFADMPKVLDGTKALMEYKPDWVLAAGGHGAMDLAKLIRIFYQRPELTFADAINGKASDTFLSKTRLIALPTYDTEGGEVSSAAYLADPTTCRQAEINCAASMPDITVIDPLLTSCANDRQEALCVISTFALAIEAAANESCCSFARPLALEALRSIAGSVPVHSALPPRPAPLLYAQCLAGMAHANSAPGLCSALYRATSPEFGVVSLGAMSAACLPHIIRQDRRQKKYLPAAEAIGLKDAAALADAVEEYADMLGLPLTLRELGVNKNTFLKNLSRISHKAMPYLPAHALPEKEPQKHIEQILRGAYFAGEQQNAR